MKTRLLVVSILLAMAGNASAEEGLLQECLDAAKKGALSDMAEGERELVEQSYTIAVDSCLQDHLTPYASSDDFSDTEDGLDPAKRRFHQFDASRGLAGRHSPSMYQHDSRSSSRVDSHPRPMHRSGHRGRRVAMPRPRN